MGEGYNARCSRSAARRPTSRVTCDAMADAGATHLQLVVDPITVESIEGLGDVLAALDHGRTAAG